VTARRPVPSAFITQIVPGSCVKAIRLPSGETSGDQSSPRTPSEPVVKVSRSAGVRYSSVLKVETRLEE
jgi:hypothetical protein